MRKSIFRQNHVGRVTFVCAEDGLEYWINGSPLKTFSGGLGSFRIVNDATAEAIWA